MKQNIKLLILIILLMLLMFGAGCAPEIPQETQQQYYPAQGDQPVGGGCNVQ